MTPLKALTIYQPWASLIMVRAKPFEFRGWDFSQRAGFEKLVGQRIVIHAASRPIKPLEIVDLLRRLDNGTTGLVPELARPLLERLNAASKCKGILELSAALGTALLGHPVRARDLATGLAPQDSDRVDHSLFGWPLTEVRPFAWPVPMPGAQGFWNYKGLFDDGCH